MRADDDSSEIEILHQERRLPATKIEREQIPQWVRIVAAIDIIGSEFQAPIEVRNERFTKRDSCGVGARAAPLDVAETVQWNVRRAAHALSRIIIVFNEHRVPDERP